MKKLILVIPILLMCSLVEAQCVATIKSVAQDPIRGSIKVTTEYKLNGILVQTGNTRYLETSGTLSEIKLLVRDDIDTHCQNIIKRMVIHRDWITARRVERQKELTDVLITDLQDRIGVSLSKSESNIDYKGKRINVKANGTHSVTDIP